MNKPRTDDIPDDLLRRRNTASRRLIAWLEHRGRRPSLMDIEEERQKRGIQ